MKWLLRSAGLVVGLALAVIVIGLLTPAGHVARGEGRFSADMDTVWSVVADIASWPEWHPEIYSARRTNDDPETWLVKGEWGELTTEIRYREPPHKLETFVDAGSFEGTWRYELMSDGDGTLVRITETGSVSNPVWRAMMRFTDLHASMRTYLRALGAQLGETVEPVVVEAGSAP